MENNQIFKKYYSRLVAEGIIKSVVCALCAGFAVIFVVALVCLLCNYNGLWIALGSGFGVAAVSGFIFYFAKFRPDIKQAARRVDALGLEERAITMLEFENDNSYIAMRQREDAKLHISNMQSDARFGIAVPAKMIAAAAVFAVAGIAISIVLGLTVKGIIPPVIPGDNPFGEIKILITYEADEGGTIDGECEQEIDRGENATPVKAVANDGWMFIGWDDGVADPYREDNNVTEDFLVMAIFEPLEEDDEDDGGDDIGDGDGLEGDEASDQPANGDGEGLGEGEDGEADGGKTNDGSGKGEGGTDGDGDDESDGKGGGAGGDYNSRYDPANQYYDGETYYRDNFEEFVNDILNDISSDGNLSAEEREFIEKYLGSL